MTFQTFQLPILLVGKVDMNYLNAKLKLISQLELTITQQRIECNRLMWYPLEIFIKRENLLLMFAMIANSLEKIHSNIEELIHSLKCYEKPRILVAYYIKNSLMIIRDHKLSEYCKNEHVMFI